MSSIMSSAWAKGRIGETDVIDIAKTAGLHAERGTRTEDGAGIDVWVTNGKGPHGIQVKRHVENIDGDIHFYAGDGWTFAALLNASIAIVFLWPNGGYALVPVAARGLGLSWTKVQHLHRSEAALRDLLGVFCCTGAQHLGTKLQYLTPAPPPVISPPGRNSPPREQSHRKRTRSEKPDLEVAPMLGPRERNKRPRSGKSE